MTEPIDRVLSRLHGVKQLPRGHWQALCPAHDDHHPSLSVSADPSGTVLLHCHAGCDPAAILRAAGLSWEDLYPTWPLSRAEPAAPPPRALGRVVAEYDYHDAAGRLLFQVVRYEPKAFRQRRPDGAGGWTWGLNGVPRVLYRLPRLLAVPEAAQPVFLVEGEKDVDRLLAHDLDLVATTNPGGAGQWRPEYSEWLRGRRVVILPDNDPPGRAHAAQVACALQGTRALQGIAAEIRVLELPGLPDHGDVSDWLAAAGPGLDPSTLLSLSAAAPLAADWLADSQPAVPAPAKPDRSSETCQVSGSDPSDDLPIPPLPASVLLPDSLGADASPWLDRYIAFSRLWSPRAYDGFHEAVGLWLLSTVAARRIFVDLGGEQYTPLYIAFAARTTLWAKSTTAEIGIELLRAAGLDWLLAADVATPQKFIRDLTRRLPDDYDRLPARRQEAVRNRLALAGQRGWFYDEFGQHLKSMGRSDGIMSDFHGLLRRFDDCKQSYTYSSLSRGEDVVDNPYLALLACLTPDDLASMARRRASAWGDGFWARFALVAPGGRDRGRGRFPEGRRSIPPDLHEALRCWHGRLGMPEVTIHGDRRAAEVQPFQPNSCTLGDGVSDAYYAYSEALLDMLAAIGNSDLDGNYARFAAKALRVATLLASLENGDRVELCHWARGQAVAERWRADLHRLYAQLNAQSNASSPAAQASLADHILAVVQRLKNPTRREIRQSIWGIKPADLESSLQRLLASGILVEHASSQTKRYSLPESKP